MRRTLVCLCALVLGLAWLPAAEAATLVLVIDGKGFGHGVGLPQEGALAMGRAGASTPQILGQFYPGTALGRASGPVRVPVLAPGAEGTVRLPQGGEVREAGSGTATAGFPMSVPAGGQVRVAWDGSRYTVTADRSDGVRASQVAPTQAPPSLAPSTTTTSTTAPPRSTTTTTERLLPDGDDPGSTTTTTTPPDGEDEPPGPSGATTTASTTQPVTVDPSGDGVTLVPARGRSYRGVMQVSAAGGPLRFVNELDVETYLKGMGEVRDPRWPAASLRVQAIIARTYALRAMAASGEICETQRCQVYLGSQAEYGAMNKAVDDSRGQVVVFRRQLASTVYSANGGGFTASTLEGFGTEGSAFPYLRAAPYRTTNPLPWTVRVGLADVGRRFGYPGVVTDVKVTKVGPSGRALEVTIVGDKGPRPVTGIAFDAGLGLRSTLFTLRTELGEAPPPPVPDADEAVAQALPEQAAVAAPPPVVPTAPGDAAVPSLPSAPTEPGDSATSSQLETTNGAAGRPLTALALVLVVGTGGAIAGALRSGRLRPMLAAWKRRRSPAGEP